MDLEVCELEFLVELHWFVVSDDILGHPVALLHEATGAEVAAVLEHGSAWLAADLTLVFGEVGHPGALIDDAADSEVAVAAE